MNKHKSIVVICGDVTAALNRRPELMHAFRNACDDAHFFCPEHDSKYFEALKQIGFETQITPVNTQGMNPVHDIGYLRTIRRELKRTNPDHVFIFHLKQIMYAGLACRLLGLKYHCLFAGLGIVFAESPSLKRKIVRLLSTFAMRMSLKNAATIFFQNPDDRALFESLNILPRKSNVVVVDGSGVSLVNFPKTPANQNNFTTFLLVARLATSKRVT